MPVTLGYWNIRGLAQPIRLQMKYLEMEFEDVRYGQGGPDWKEVKENLGMPFPNCHMAAGFQITADLPGQQYNFPQDIAPTDLRPDIVMWSTSAIYLVELTVPFETNIVGAAERKAHRYRELASACGRSHHTSIITLELPYLIDGDMKLSQSAAIMKYISRKAGKLLPATEQEQQTTDMMEGVVGDFRLGFILLCYNPKFAEQKESYLKDVKVPLKRFCDYLKDRKWVAGDLLTYVDFSLYEILDHHRLFEPALLEGYPALKEYLDRFEALPNVKEYLQSESCIKRPVNSPFAQWT